MPHITTTIPLARTAARGSPGLEDGSVLTQIEYRTLEHLYKRSQAEFDAWLRSATSYTKSSSTTFRDFEGRAHEVVKSGDKIPASALASIEDWLKGRQRCYAHHLLLNNADDGHLYPIFTARKLIFILAPDDADAIVNKCTPADLEELVFQYGSEVAKEYFCCSEEEKRTRDRSTSSTCSQEEKMERMRQSWRRNSDSSTDSSVPINKFRGRTSTRAPCAPSPSSSVSPSPSPTFSSRSSVGSWRSSQTSAQPTPSTSTSPLPKSSSSSSSSSSPSSDGSSGRRKLILLPRTKPLSQ